MADENPTPEATNADTDTQQQPGGDQSDQESNPTEQLPEWAQSELKRARDDAAKHRTGKRELQQKVTELTESANRVPELETALSEARNSLSDRDAELGKLRAVIATGRFDPDQYTEVAARITGTTAEEWDADAHKLAELFGSSAQKQPERKPDLTQGAGNGSQALNGDPMERQMRRVLGI